MRGHINKRSSWQFVIDLGLRPLQRCPACRKRYWVEGKRLDACPRCLGPLEDHVQRRQEFHTGYKSKREAEEALATTISALSSGSYTPPSKTLLAEFLRNEWLPATRHTIRPTTYLSYQGHVELHIIPALGHLPLQQLSSAHINAFYAKLLSKRANTDGDIGGNADENGAKKKRTLSPSTVRRIHATLHRAMRDAVRWNKITRSPADGADPPRAAGCGEGEMKVWSVRELKTFLESERENRLYPLWLTLATTGMRRGEALGLRWEDIDLDAGTLSIRQTRVLAGYEPVLSTPKTKKGRRLVALDPATTGALGRHRHLQSNERLAQGAAGKDSGFVFTRGDGEPYHPERVSKLFRKAAKMAGLPRIRLHDLRHTHATLALSAGIHPKVVSERLGHANIGITLDTYSHCLPALSEEAACRIAALVVPGWEQG